MADRDGPDGSQRRSLMALGVVVVLFLVGGCWPTNSTRRGNWKIA